MIPRKAAMFLFKIRSWQNLIPVNVSILGILPLLCLVACGSPCSELPATFSSYDEAVSAVESASFSIEDDVNTSKSSFIRDADFYSCDGYQGYLILQFKDNDYIFEGVPLSVWEGFKHADSFGEFYDRNIKGRYRYHSN